MKEEKQAINLYIGQRVRQRREALNMTQDDLAHALNYKGRSAIARLERGDYDLKRSKIYQLANVLHTTVDWLLGETSDSEIPTPVINGMKTGVGMFVDDESTEPLTIPLSFMTKGGNYFGTVYHGFDMPNGLKTGDICVFRETQDFKDGDVVYINDEIKIIFEVKMYYVLITNLKLKPDIVSKQDATIKGVLETFITHA